MPVIPKKASKPTQLSILRLHRLLEFERVFTLYLEGKTSAQHVRDRAKKMLEIGLPRLR